VQAQQYFEEKKIVTAPIEVFVLQDALTRCLK
jgi:hypothetical protein